VSLTSVFLGGWLELILPGERITILQTRDPYASRNKSDLQFIASGEITLEIDDKLDNETLSALGFGEPGEKFWVRCIIYFCKKNHSTSIIDNWPCLLPAFETPTHIRFRFLQNA